MPHVNPPRYTPVEVERFVNKEMEDGTHRVREIYNGIDQYPAYEDFTLKVQLESGVPLQEIPLPQMTPSDMQTEDFLTNLPENIDGNND